MDMSAIGQQIDQLIELQKIDGQIYELRAEKSKKPQKIAALQNAFKEKVAASGYLDEELKKMQLERKDKEVDLAIKEEQIIKLQGQLYQVKTNKEYSALEREIAGHKADNSLLEEEILLLMDAIEAKKGEIASAKGVLQVEEQKMKAEESKAKDEIAAIDKKLDELESARKNIAPGVDKQLLMRYERILISKQGTALVPVVHESCGGCHMNLPPQMVNEVQMKEQLIFCERCARILYWPKKTSE